MNFDEWITVPARNVIARSFDQARESVDLVLRGEWPVCWLSGPGGVGKTAVAKDAIAAWEDKGLKPIYSNPANAKDLLAALKEAKCRRPIVMEEADTVFRSEKCLNILKIATDRKGTGIYEGVKVRAPMVIATNAPLHDLSRWDKKLRPHIEALFNRIPPVCIPDDRYALWEYTCYLALSTAMLRWTPSGRTTSAGTCVRALAWFTSHMDRIELLTPRTLCNIVEWMTIMSPVACASKLDSLLLPKAPGPMPIPLIDWQNLVDEMVERRRAKKAA